jgi:hypothetical protein
MLCTKVVATRITDVVRGPLMCVIGPGELVLADVKELRLRCELQFQNSEIGPLVSSVLSARVSSVVSAARVSSLVSSGCVSSVVSAARVSSVVRGDGG